MIKFVMRYVFILYFFLNELHKIVRVSIDIAEEYKTTVLGDHRQEKIKKIKKIDTPGWIGTSTRGTLQLDTPEERHTSNLTRLAVVATWLTRLPWLCSFECLPVLMPQSNRVRFEVWRSSGVSSCRVPRVDVPIQLGVSFLFVSFFFLPIVSQDCSLVFFYYINRNSHLETHTILCGSFKNVNFVC